MENVSVAANLPSGPVPSLGPKTIPTAAPETSSYESEHVIVALRVKPMVGADAEGREPCIKVHRGARVGEVDLIKEGSKTSALASQRERITPYAFDLSFDGDAPTRDVFRGVVERHGLIERLMKGINCTIFAYGATGAGKTYTMLGSGGTGGVIQMTAERMFERVHALNAVEANPVVIQVTATYAEIYNESIHDLLSTSTKCVKLKPCEDKEGNVRILGLQSTVVRGNDELMALVQAGTKRRRMSPTAANEVSSRSHAVLNVTLTWRNRSTATSRPRRAAARKGGRHSAAHRRRDVKLESSLCLIDLAGSERAARTLNHGKQLREGASINKSLLALASCIRALTLAKKKGMGRVKYRDSKLTLLLKPSLQGKSILVMIACVDPKPVCYEDSNNTLKYANRAKNIKCKARVVAAPVMRSRKSLASLFHDKAHEVSARLKAGSPAIPPRSMQRAGDAARSSRSNLAATRVLKRRKKSAKAKQAKADFNGAAKRNGPRARRRAEAAAAMAAAQAPPPPPTPEVEARRSARAAQRSQAVAAIRAAKRKASAKKKALGRMPSVDILVLAPPPPPTAMTPIGTPAVGTPTVVTPTVTLHQGQNATTSESKEFDVARTVKLPQRHSSVGMPALRQIVRLQVEADAREVSPAPSPPMLVATPAVAASLAASLPGRRASAAFEQLLRRSSTSALAIETAAPFSPEEETPVTAFSPKVSATDILVVASASQIHLTHCALPISLSLSLSLSLLRRSSKPRRALLHDASPRTLAHPPSSRCGLRRHCRQGIRHGLQHPHASRTTTWHQT